MVTSLAHQPGEILPCSPNIDLSDELILNLKSQSIVKHTVDLYTEELEVAFRAMPSSMSKCFFEGDLPKVKGPESNFVDVVEELVAIQSITSVRGYVQQTTLKK